MALNDEQVQKVRQTLYTAGWNDVMKPALENRGRQALKALVLSRTERVAAFKGTDFDTDDDVLRAVIRDVEWMTCVWDNEVKVSEYNRQRDELDRLNSNEGTATPNG